MNTKSASIWPTWASKNPDLMEVMPFHRKFWAKGRHTPNEVAELELVKGFITALPIEWTKDENNNMGYHTSLVAHNDAPGTLQPDVKEKTVLQAKQSQDLMTPSGEEAAG